MKNDGRAARKDHPLFTRRFPFSFHPPNKRPAGLAGLGKKEI